MTEHTEQTTTEPGPVPARIQIDDFIEAVTRGVARALAAQEDVSGYAAQFGEDRPSFMAQPGGARPPSGVFIGLWSPPPRSPDASGGQDTSFGRR